MQCFAAAVVPLVPKQAFMTDTAAEVMRFAADGFEAGHGVALATLVHIRGGSARPLGSHMAIRDDALYCGFVSGGCTEAAIASEAVEAISKGCDRNVMLGEGSPFFDIVLPCGGGITVAIHVLRDSEPLRRVLAELASRRPSGLQYEPASQRLAVSDPNQRAGWHGNAFVTAYRPRARVFLAGRSIEVEVAAKVAEAAGYEVHCHEAGGPAPVPDSIDADTAVALLYHDIDLEIPVLQAALHSEPFYLGALGSSRTHDRRIRRLKELGYSQSDIARIKSPIGIFEKARDAQSLALSVLADLAACRLSQVR
jgi:xanthine dehydrogenase accessory factor